MMKTRWFTRSQREQPGGGASSAGSNSAGMITSSERSAMLTNSERSRNESIDIDFDFSVTESGRTVAHMLKGSDDNMEKDDDGLDFSITSSGRTIEHIMQDQMNGNAKQQKNDESNPNSNNIPTGVPAVRATISNPLTIPFAKQSPARAIPPPNDSMLLHNNHGSSHPGSQDSSGSAFLNGILNPAATATTQLSHTPPTAFGTSYENRHFGKRQRSGSVSGRLRSASDLEEKGLIDRQQKAILKDLIICGDEDLQHALDKYEEGNPADLENMIRSGALQNKAVPDLDLLGDLDLDLDFLTVNDAIGGAVNDLGGAGQDGPGMYTLNQQQQAHQAQHQQHHAGPSHASHATTTAQRSTMMKPPPPRQAGDTTHTRTVANASPSIVTHEYDDGIGELEFTGDFGDNAEGYYGDGATANDHSHSQFMNQQHHPGKQHRPGSPSIGADDMRLRSNSLFGGDDMRLRSNSLFSALINEPRPIENHDLQYGGWMDRVPASASMKNNQYNDTAVTDRGETHHSSHAAPANSVSQPIPIHKADETTAVDSDDDEMHDDDNTKTKTTPKKQGRRKSDSAAMEDRKQKARLKQELAEQKRREKQEKREKKEREKQEKREARLLAKAEKKKQKEQKKDTGGAAAMSVEEDEKPVHIPGSGRPRSMSDPNLRATRDEFGHVEIERPDGWIGAYSPESRKKRIDKFLAKRHQRVWTKTVKYDVRKNFADSRLRVKGRFVKKEDEMLMRDLMSMT